MNLHLLRFASLVLVACLAWPPAAAAQEAWTPEILTQGEPYLPDFSYAGYRWGEEPFPQPDHVVNVTAYGALPDDGADDTDALREALQAAADHEGIVAVEFPAGRFVISDIIFIERSNLIVRGAGSGEGGTEIHMPRPMADMEKPPLLVELGAYLRANDKKQNGEWFSPFSWTGGILWTRTPEAEAFRAVTTLHDGSRGGHHFHVDDPAGIEPGRTVRIRWYNREGDDSPILHHIYQMEGIDFGNRLWEKPNEPLVTQDVQVLSVTGNTVRVKEPLLHDIRPAWQTDLAMGDQLETVGFEGFRVTFPDVEYGGHHLEAGYNAFYLTGVRHGWMKDVTIHNADSAILSDDASALTLEGIGITGRRSHYGIHLGRVHHVLVRDFQVETHAYHSISFNTGSRGSVFTHGEVFRPTLDQHRGVNHQNLFDHIQTLEDRPESDLFVHGGAGYWGPTHGAFNTFWNVRLQFTHEDAGMDEAIDLGIIRDGGSVRIIGMTANRPISFVYEPDAYVEGLEQEGLAVPSLYAYQLNRRLAAGSR